jgi:tripartite-type tricarboxylate transporter receptor subunit TctC
LNDNVPYDGAKDFAPITWTSMAPNILVVHPTLPVRSVKDLIALAKARPGELNFTISSMGGSGHLATELFMSMAAVKLVRVPYRSGSQEITDLISGQVQLAFSNAASVAPHLKSGRLKALAVTR